MKKISILTCVVIVLAAIGVSVTGTFLFMRAFPQKGAVSQHAQSIDDISAKLTELDQKFRENYIGDTPDYAELEKGIMLGYLSATGDEHAMYYTADEYAEMMRESMGDSEGIGISVVWNGDEKAIEVIQIFPDSPASKTDLRVGDLIVAVGVGKNAEDVAQLGYDKALSMMRGKAGTKCEFTALRDGRTIDFSIERGQYELQTVTCRVYEGDSSVGIIRISEFEKVTPEQFRNAVRSLEAKGASKFIIDLRNDPGGDRAAIIDVLDYILPEGPLFRLKQADGSVEVVDKSDASCIDNEMVVLVNENTASAAELFAAAMRDYDRAKIVGTTTYGKGSMQTFYELSDGSVFKTTSDLYYPPYGDNYDGVGITPDVTVELDEALQSVNPYKIADADDNQLAAAYETLTGKKAAASAAKSGDDDPGDADAGTTPADPGVTRGALAGIYRKLVELDASFRGNYIGEMPDVEEIERYVMLGYLTATGDDYAMYYTADEYAEMVRESMGDSEGIGISVIWNSDEEAIEVINVFPDSPASKTDIAPGDLIVAVGVGENAESVASLGYEMALSMMRGGAGTVCEFTARRGTETIEFSIERGHYELQTVTYRVYEKDPTVGIISISEFEGVTPAQLEDAVDALEAAGAPNIIFDLRNNPGGDLDSILDVLDYILPEGPLFRLLQPDGSVAVVDTSDAFCIDNPFVVLVNGSTASAAELFTAAMRDYDRAKIVGTTTFGKGSMQTFYKLSDGSVYKTTSDMYYPPYGDNYDGVGITPDVEVELDEALRSMSPYKIPDADDNQLAAAYETLKGEMN